MFLYFCFHFVLNEWIKIYSSSKCNSGCKNAQEGVPCVSTTSYCKFVWFVANVWMPVPILKQPEIETLLSCTLFPVLPASPLRSLLEMVTSTPIMWIHGWVTEELLGSTLDPRLSREPTLTMVEPFNTIVNQSPRQSLSLAHSHSNVDSHGVIEMAI